MVQLYVLHGSQYLWESSQPVPLRPVVPWLRKLVDGTGSKDLSKPLGQNLTPWSLGKVWSLIRDSAWLMGDVRDTYKLLSLSLLSSILCTRSSDSSSYTDVLKQSRNCFRI